MTLFSRYTVLFAFFLSGSAGLLYESIWSHYLGLFLGHSAYAQTLTLCYFMGGLAIGAWLAGRYLKNLKRPLMAYAIVELLLAFLGVSFHYVFETLIQLSYDSIMPALSAYGLVGIYKWMLSGALLLPSAILLGSTFPLISTAFIRQAEKDHLSGSALALLYFVNSIGAVLGVLMVTFFLLPKYGTHFSLNVASILNLIVGLVCLVVSLKLGVSNITHASNNRVSDSSYKYIFLIVALLSGAASFMYEIAWIRMLNLVLGTTLHVFELMLSAFILGLALGGLWIRKRIDNIDNIERSIGYVQVVMGIAAMLTLPIYVMSFDWVASLLQSALQKTELGYSLYNVTTSVIAILIMVPSTFCAGMLLPLVTYALLKKGYGEASIGSVYAANTAGAILGAVFATHIGMSFLGLKWLVITAASLDCLIGIYLLNKYKHKVFESNYAGFSYALVLTIIVLQVPLSANRLSSGTFRYERAQHDDSTKVLFYKDGKTSSISVTEAPIGNKKMRIIATNGKPDAGLVMGQHGYSPDETTMLVAAAIPLLLKPDAEEVANIGFGSGLTTHALLTSPTVKQVDTIEIEQQMVTGARLFEHRNYNAYNDPRSNIIIDDAKSYFAANQKKYDVIVSEPSNPWVAGVGNLFSTEFYKEIKKYLKEDGVLVQWLQLYEITTETISTAFKALDSNFKDYDFYLANNSDLIIIAKMQSSDMKIHSMDTFPMLREEMARLQITSSDQIASRLAGTKDTISPLLQKNLSLKPNSDYHPLLSLYAPRDRFTGADSVNLINASISGIPYKELLPHSSLYTLKSLDIMHPYLPAYRAAIPIVRAIQDEQKKADMLTKVQLGEYSILTDIESYCGQDHEKEHIWLALMIEKAKLIHPNLERELRLEYAQAEFMQKCLSIANNEETKKAIELQASVAQQDWQAVYDSSKELLNYLMKNNSSGNSANLASSNYALNHYIFAGIKLNKNNEIKRYLKKNGQTLSAIADDVTRWLQSMV